MTAKRASAEDSPDYAYDPARRRRRARWRGTMSLLGVLRLVLRLVAMSWLLVLGVSSMGQVLSQAGEQLLGPAGEPPPPQPGALLGPTQLRVLAIMGGFMVLSGVIAAVRAACGPVPGAIHLGGDDRWVAVVRETRSAALAARSSLARLHTPDIRRRLEPHVDTLDATTWTMATVMGADAPGLEQELRRRCSSVQEAARELEELVRAESALEALVPAIPPIPPPDAETLLQVNDVVLRAAHDEVRGLLRGIDALTGPASYAGDPDPSATGEIALAPPQNRGPAPRDERP